MWYLLRLLGWLLGRNLLVRLHSSLLVLELLLVLQLYLLLPVLHSHWLRWTTDSCVWNKIKLVRYCNRILRAIEFKMLIWIDTCLIEDNFYVLIF